MVLRVARRFETYLSDPFITLAKPPSTPRKINDFFANFAPLRDQSFVSKFIPDSNGRMPVSRDIEQFIAQLRCSVSTEAEWIPASALASCFI